MSTALHKEYWDQLLPAERQFLRALVDPSVEPQEEPARIIDLQAACVIAASGSGWVLTEMGRDVLAAGELT